MLEEVFPFSVFRWSFKDVRNPENEAFDVKNNNVLTCSAGGHSNFFDFDGDETLAHLSSLMFFGNKKHEILYFKDPHSRIIMAAYTAYPTCTWLNPLMTQYFFNYIWSSTGNLACTSWSYQTTRQFLLGIWFQKSLKIAVYYRIMESKSYFPLIQKGHHKEMGYNLWVTSPQVRASFPHFFSAFLLP